MSMKRITLARLLVLACVLGPLLAAATPSTAQESFAAIGGKVLDTAGAPLAGYRVVYRDANDLEVFISLPSDADGEYIVSLPEGRRYNAVAVIAPSGRRTPLAAQLQIPGMAGLRHDVRVDVAAATFTPSGIAQTYPGSDRLVLAYAEDAVLVADQRWELQVEVADFDVVDRTVARVQGAIQLPQLDGVEFGGRVGLGSVDNPPGVSDDSGVTDLDAWTKFMFRTNKDGTTDYAAGFVVTLPVGDDRAGLGQDALRSKFFGSVRRALPWGVVSGHVGLRLNEAGRIGGVRRDGEIAPGLGAALILPRTPNITVIVEAMVEGESFDGVGTDARLLAGVNWRLREVVTLRFAAAAGLADGAPDSQLLVGYSVDF